MSKPYQPLEVIETGDRCRYHVRSETNPRHVYTVDLLANEGRGECLCKWWQTHCWPLIREGETIHNPDTACKHVRAARRHFMAQLLTHMGTAEAAGYR